MKQICRFCGVKSNELKDFETYENLIEGVRNYLPVKISFSDYLPQKFCGSCEISLNTLKHFFDLIRKTDKTFRKRTKCVDGVQSESDDDEPLIRLRRMDDLVSIKSENVELSKDSTVNDILKRLSKGSVSISKLKNHDQIQHLEPKIEVNSMDYDYEILNDSGSDIEYHFDKDALVDSENDSNSEELDASNDDADFVPSGKSKQKKNRSTIVKKSSTKKTENEKETVITISDPKYVCGICKYPHQTFEELKDHIASGACNEIALTCEVCGKIYDTRVKMSKHRSTHFKNQKLACEKCGRMYSGRTNLENHQLQCLGKQDFDDDREGPIQFKCTDCDKTFARRSELFEHIKNHPKELLCNVCGKISSNKKYHMTHMRGHSNINIRPFPCEVCGKAFRIRASLRAHMHIHTGIKSYVCETCGKAFAKQSSLRYHIRDHTGETPYACTMCDSKFSTLDKLKTHQKKHQTGYILNGKF